MKKEYGISEMELVWFEEALQKVLGEYVKGFKSNKDGKVIYSWEAFVDTARGKVVFKLVLRSP